MLQIPSMERWQFAILKTWPKLSFRPPLNKLSSGLTGYPRGNWALTKSEIMG